MPLHLDRSEILSRTKYVREHELCPRYVQCPLPTLDEKFPDLGDLSVGAFINVDGGTGGALGGKRMLIYEQLLVNKNGILEQYVSAVLPLFMFNLAFHQNSINRNHSF